MKKNLNELEKKIVEKNAALETLKKNSGHRGEDIQKLHIELDRLLYAYYKSVG